MTTNQDGSQYFQQIAPIWDQVSAGYFGTPVRDAAIARAYLRPEMHVADIGAGTGFMSAGIAPLVRRVYVVDSSEAMIEVARKNLAGFDNVEFHVADGISLPFPDEMLDAVFANMYLHHTADPFAAMREMVRVLRPGGRLVITDMNEHPYAWLKGEMADIWQGFNRATIRGWLRDAGLVNVVVDCTGESCCASSENAALKDSPEREANISVFVATGSRRMIMRETVRENYGGLAQSTTSCGCGSSSSEGGCCCGGAKSENVTFETGYTSEELSGAPRDAADISLGCGNPTALAGLKPGEVVLDIGSGGGLDAFLAAEKVGPAGKVIGVDMTPAMLDRARATAWKNNITNVEFRQGYAEELPVETGSVDVIISNCVINLTEDKGLVFHEAFRVLKPGGRLEVSDMVTSDPIPTELKESAQGWSECVTGALPEKEYLDLIGQAGFERISTRRSASMGEIMNIQVYSVSASAIKPRGDNSMAS